MVCYSYKDTRLSVFRPAASRNLNPCCSWPQAVDPQQSLRQHVHAALRPPWYLRPGEGRACYQSRENSQVPSQLILFFLGTNQQVLAEKSFPFAKYRHTGFHSTALSKPLSGFLQACRGKDCFREFLGENKKRLFSHKLLLFAGISSGPANVKHIGNTTTPEKWHLLPLQSTHQPRRHILQINPEVPAWSKHVPGQKLALPPCNVPHTIHDM